MSYIGKIWNPELYHGNNIRGDFFEGWYFKNVNYSGTNIISVIPGVFKSRDKSKEHAFIQFIDGITTETHYVRFDISEFRSSNKNFDIAIGKNRFSTKEVYINIDREDFRAYGTLKFDTVNPWPVRAFSPGAMGWYGFIPFMECNHGVLSLDHRVEGKLFVKNKVFIIARGRGYIEKDWGKSFPSSYIWMQSNNFTTPNTSFMASVARIPWLGGSFKGILMGLFLNNKLYRFASYTGAKIDYLLIDDKIVEFRVYDKHYTLHVKVKRGTGGHLIAPYERNMLERVTESLNSEIELKFYRYTGRASELVYSDIGKYAGLEVTGDVNYLTVPYTED
jgi:hypothetical protein